MAEEKGAEVVVTDTVVDPIAEKDIIIGKLQSDLDNYKNVALKRLGKLPGDADFVAGVDEKTGLTIEETVRLTLIQDKLIKTEEERNDDIKKVQRENSELKLALKNQPGSGQGGSGSSTGPEVKDNVFSEAQLADLRARAVRIKADPEAFIAKAKENILSRTR